MGEHIIERFPGGMNIDGSGYVSKIFVNNNDFVKKGNEIAIFDSNGYEMALTAEKSGVIELLISENQKLLQNDILWKIKTTPNTM
jgi:biotin carboxyl carrier protein